MRRPLLTPVLGVVILGALLAPPPVHATEPGTELNFELVGHNPLFNRGMNAAPAVFDHFVYVGNRTDGSPQHRHPGVVIVDVADPSNPTVVGEIDRPREGRVTRTSRELRVWPEQKLLMVLNFNCSALIHACTSGGDVGAGRAANVKFFDLTDPTAPRVISIYRPTRTPHEFFLWVDPLRPGRALLFMSTPTSTDDNPNLIVTDISRARDGEFTEVVTWLGNDEFSEQQKNNEDVRLHSLGVSPDGTRAYLAYLGGGFLILDTSDLANAVPDPQVSLISSPADSPDWTNQTVHSAVPLLGRPYALTTDEIYGDLLDPLTRPFNESGCPWGWVHLIDISDEAHPALVSEHRTEENEQSYCSSREGLNPLNTTWTSYAAHNPTLTDDLAFVTWHSSGLQAIDLTDPANPSRAGFFSPVPLDRVATEDPALSLGLNKVVMWSYPIIVDGLIYAVDVRNGLYVVRYTGPRADEVAAIGFLEGNSNLGDALVVGGP